MRVAAPQAIILDGDLLDISGKRVEQDPLDPYLESSRPKRRQSAVPRQYYAPVISLRACKPELEDF